MKELIAQLRGLNPEAEVVLGIGDYKYEGGVYGFDVETLPSPKDDGYNVPVVIDYGKV